MLNKKSNNGKPDIWFKNHNPITEVDEGSHENYDSDDEKKEKTCLKSISLEFFNVIPMILVLIFINFRRYNFPHINITRRKCSK